MDLLEVPLDALVLRFHSLPTAAAGSFWTSVAVLTAALGVWVVRAVASKPDASSTSTSTSSSTIATAANCLSPVELISASARLAEETPRADQNNPEPIVLRSPTPHVEEVSTPKARFTAYFPPATSAVSCRSFDGDANVNEEEESELENEDSGVRNFSCKLTAEVDCGVTAAWSGGWETEPMALKRRGDLGWYSYQDIKALNGSVVRLWDVGRDGGGAWSPETSSRLRRRW